MDSQSQASLETGSAAKIEALSYVSSELISHLDEESAQQHSALSNSPTLAWRYLLRRTSRYADVHRQPAGEAGERVTEAMQEQRLSTADVADALGITPTQACSLVRQQRGLSARELLPIVARLRHCDKRSSSETKSPLREWLRCSCRVCARATATCFKVVRRQRRSSKWVKMHYTLPLGNPIAAVQQTTQQGSVRHA